jgi:hypothetical protein
VAERTRPNPKMRRGLSGLPVCWKVDEHERIQELEWFRPPEHNTLPPLCVSCIESVIESVLVTLCAFPFIV